jgi:hypothetical protein
MIVAPRPVVTLVAFVVFRVDDSKFLEIFALHFV